MTSTVPVVPAGEVTVTEVDDTNTTLVPGADPKLTALTPVKLVPVMVTDVPPAVGPDTGLTAVTVGPAS